MIIDAETIFTSFIFVFVFSSSFPDEQIELSHDVVFVLAKSSLAFHFFSLLSSLFFLLCVCVCFWSFLLTEREKEEEREERREKTTTTKGFYVCVCLCASVFV
jgi:amino acid transporter